MIYKNNEAIKKQKQGIVLNKIEQNPNHYYISGCYENKASELVVCCELHDSIVTTTFDNYRRAKTGTPCCGKKSASDALKNREFSSETLKKISQSAKNKPPKEAGSGQDWRRGRHTVAFEKGARNLWHNECAITGEKTKLEIHHYFSGSKNSINFSDDKISLHERFRYEPKATVLLAKRVHASFHKDFGYENTTLDHFILFVEKLISSQAHQEWCEGSETRGVKPERLQNLHERLVQTKQDFSL